jgi:hypothetical protein
MKVVSTFVLASLTLALFAATASAVVIKKESVTGGVLQQTWVQGFGVQNNATPVTLLPADPAYANPSGDHTVISTTNAVPDSGGIVLPCTDPLGQADYVWEADMFTGAGNTRRGLVIRADASFAFQNCYQFVIQSGLFQINFRKLLNQTPTTMGTWFTNTLPGGIPQPNTWHHMKVVAAANAFDCYFDGVKLNTLPIIDSNSPLLTGWVGLYNFRFDLGGVPVLWDDATLSTDVVVGAKNTTWGRLKTLYR